MTPDNANRNHADEVTDSTEPLKSRLTNWKFESAAALLKADDHTEAAEVIHALAAQFENCGHFDGEMGDLIGAVVELLLHDLSQDEVHQILAGPPDEPR